MRGTTVFLLIAALASLAAAVGEESELLRLKQQAQEKVRNSAAELISGILDVQLRQLEENNLQHLPIHREIQSMRANIDALIETEMQQVVELLVKAQGADGPQRTGHLNLARETIREVVVALMAERQRLHRRLQIARLAELARQLIDLEGEVYTHTSSLPEQAPDERERLTLNTIQDQRDVAALFGQLIKTLEEVGSWGGHVGAAAAEGLAALNAGRVAEELAKAEQLLAASKFQEAAQSELAVIKGLRALVGRIDAAQGLARADREALLNRVREMISRQEQLRDATGQSELRDVATKDEFAARQQDIRQDLNKLAESLQDFPTTEPLMDRTEAAAYQAETELFDGNRAGALVQQKEVIGGLAQVEGQLEELASSKAHEQQADASVAASQAESQQPAPGRTSPTEKPGSDSSPGDSPTEAANDEMPLASQPAAKGDGRSTNVEGDADVASRRFHQEPWFAKLPPSLRKAIQATSRRAAPRGYEERLKRYFESID